MADTDYLSWPFLEPRHRELALELDAWAAQNIPQQHGHDVARPRAKGKAHANLAGAPAH